MQYDVLVSYYINITDSEKAGSASDISTVRYITVQTHDDITIAIR